ncbi:glycosyltransferase family 2 protein [Mariniphaga sp.]|uniref:glycosyltransferase family 2 protein n=1 Tax=Mariniphaga sp. TaxID=1954475 RepID=UPI0035652546
MKDIAVLITCHNRKEKTLSCLKYLFIAYDHYTHKNTKSIDISLKVYLTDDGCTDGTADSVRIQFTDREIHILQGDGNLYWAGGMRLAWRKALKGNYDFYLLLNDDTIVVEDVFEKLFEAHAYSIKTYEKDGIYSGCTSAGNNPQKITYGGDVWVNQFFATKKRLSPNGEPQLVDMANANILLISKSVIERIGIFCDKYTHGMADFDYTIQARKKGIPVLIASDTCGICDKDHSFSYQEFAKLNYSKRKKYLNSPKGSAKNYLLFMKRNVIHRYPLVYFGYISKLFFPKMYLWLSKKRYL